MSRLNVALGMVLLLLAVSAVMLGHRLGEQRERNSLTAARVLALETALAAPAMASAPVESGSAPSSGTEVLPASAVPASAAPAREAAAATAAQPGAGNAPADLMRGMRRSMLAQRYPDLAAELGLTPEEAERLLDLIDRRETDIGMDLMSRQSDAGGDRAAFAEISRRINEKEQAYEGEMVQLLGGKYDQWKAYQRTASQRQRETAQRQQEAQLRHAVTAGTASLSDEKFNAFNTAIKAEQQRIGQEMRGMNPQQQLRRMTEQQGRLVEAASPHLDAAQLEGYRRHLQQQMDMMRMMSGAMGAGAGGNAPPRPAAP